jgi:hypothetical protein
VKTIRYLFAFTAWTFTCFTGLKAQQSSFAQCFKENVEKVFVQLDKSILITGEELKMNAFVVNASTHKPSVLSKILYFELDNAANMPVFYWRINLDNGTGSGMVSIPDSLQSGEYKLKAYTNWMRNNSSGFFYTTNLFINSLSGKSENGYLKSIVADSASLDIVTESDHLTEGLTNNIGVNIKPARSTTLNLKDNEGVIVKTIITNNDGRAVFSFDPQLGKNYTLIANDNGTSRILPLTYSYGAVLDLSNDANNLIVSVKSRFLHKEEDARLLFKSRGRILCEKPIEISKDSVIEIISHSSLPAGIVEVSLISGNHKLFAKRLTAIQPVGGCVKAFLKDGFLNRQKAGQLNISASCIPGNDSVFLSLTIAAKPQLKNRTANHAILPYLLFASELDGYSFFDDNISENQIDTVLMTTSADKYLWNDSRFDSISRCRFLVENKGYIFQGKLLQKSTLVPLSNVMVILSISDSIPVLRYCKTDSLGRFYFLLNRFFDNRDLILQAQNAEVSDLLWKIDYKTTFTKTLKVDKQQYSHEFWQYLDFCRNLRFVDAVYETEMITEPKVGWSAGSQVYNLNYKPDFVVRPEDYSELIDFKELSSNILPTVSFKKSVNEYSLHVFDMKNRIQYSQNASLLLNGIPFSDLSYIAALGSKDIANIEIFSTHLMYGDWSFYGLVSVFTKDRKMPKSFLDDKNICFVHNKVSGVDRIHLYHDDSFSDRFLPDFKRTLYAGFLNSKTEQVFHVSASNLIGYYCIDLQGITKNGEPLNFFGEMEVK